MEIKYPLNGMDGFLVNMMMFPLQEVIVSMILSFRDLMIGIHLTQLLEFSYLDNLLPTLTHLTITDTEEIVMQNNGNQQQKGYH